MVQTGDRVRARRAGEYSPIMRVADVRWLASTPDESTIKCECVNPDGTYVVWFFGPNDLDVIEHAGPPDGIYQLEDIVYVKRAMPSHRLVIIGAETHLDPFRQYLECQEVIAGIVRRYNADELAFVSRTQPSKSAYRPQNGENVKLRSGGPPITVLTAGAKCLCGYFDGGEYRTIVVPEHALEKA